ncbi:hypothetical protein B0H17DRAFT_1136169 [Mycena rosella]|uniref:Uncharacterized protein n=1 Tax=Mycena rosella TaxID=1033263 RepID=A0AAD7GER9_MYCRO|nr:hypothetical protein B0H17DRAFT_1136169 [Mycena rosella]
MSAAVSRDQPFQNFLNDSTPHGGSLTAPGDAVPTPLGDMPLAGPVPLKAEEGAPAAAGLALSKDLRTTLDGKHGPPSTARTITRSATAPALVPDTQNDQAGGDSPPSPPAGTKGKSETVTEKATRVESNFIKLADIVGGVDGRLAKLERAHDNLATESKLRALVRSSREDGRGTAAKDDEQIAPRAPSPSPTPSSVSSYDDDAEAVYAQLDGLDDKIQDVFRIIENHASDLGVLERRTAAPFTITQFSDAVKLQFETITKDRDTIIVLVDSNASKQLKINKTQDAKVKELEGEIRLLKAAMARQALAPAPPLLSRSRSQSVVPRSGSPYQGSRSRSPVHHGRGRTSSRSPVRHARSPPPSRARTRSPGDDHATKRFRTAPSPEREVVIMMGPIKLGVNMKPEETFKLHMDTALPGYTRASQYHITIHREGSYLHIALPSMAEARALIDAWGAHTVEGYRSVKMVLKGDRGGARGDGNGNQNTIATGSGGGKTRPKYRGGGGQHRSNGAIPTLRVTPTKLINVWVKNVAEIFKKHGATLPQSSLAWLMNKDAVTASIIGTTWVEKLDYFLGKMEVGGQLVHIGAMNQFSIAGAGNPTNIPMSNSSSVSRSLPPMSNLTPLASCLVSLAFRFICLGLANQTMPLLFY